MEDTMEESIKWHIEFNKSWEASVGFPMPTHASPCIECDGSGSLDIALAPWHEQIAECPHCGGEGYFE